MVDHVDAVQVHVLYVPAESGSVHAKVQIGRVDALKDELKVKQCLKYLFLSFAYVEHFICLLSHDIQDAVELGNVELFDIRIGDAFSDVGAVDRLSFTQVLRQR